MICGLGAPRKREAFVEETIRRSEVAVWYHVYRPSARIKAQTFNPGLGDTRFAPLTGTSTYYAASTARAAYLESILHDVSLQPPGVVDLDVLRTYRIATVELPNTVRCVSFHTPFLPRLKLTRAQLIDSPAVCYPETRAWAQAAFDQRLKAQGIAYTSRRDDAGRCLMLFGKRLRTRASLRVLVDEATDIVPRRVEFLALVRMLKLHQI
jgi:hypothetical protein